MKIAYNKKDGEKERLSIDKRTFLDHWNIKMYFFQYELFKVKYGKFP